MLLFRSRPSVLLVVACLGVIADSNAQTRFRQIQRELTIRNSAQVFVSGLLKDREGNVIPRAEVGVSTWEGHVWQPLTRTTEEGTFAFAVRLMPGEYRLIAVLGRFELAFDWLVVFDTRPVKAEVVLNASDYNAQANRLPERAPRVGLLPPGSVAPPPPPPPPPPPEPPSRQPNTTVPKPRQTLEELVTVLYATNRTAISTPRRSVAFSDSQAASQLSYGAATVRIPPVHRPGVLERPSVYRLQLGEDQGKHIVIRRIETVSNDAGFYGRLNATLDATAGEAFLFIHGYNVEFEDAVRRTAQLFYDLKFDGAPILFSWPGQYGWWRYSSAEDQVLNSSIRLRELLRNIIRRSRPKSINIVAHSLGNRVLATALDGLVEGGHFQAGPRFNELVMAAPDINIANFQDVVPAIRAAARRTTVYASSKDVALVLSKVFHRYPRVGDGSELANSEGVDMVDASDLNQDLLGHSYYGGSISVIRDVFLLIKQGLPPEGRFLPKVQRAGRSFWRIPVD